MTRPVFINGLGLSLGAKFVSINDRFIFFNNIQAFSKRRRGKKLRRILHEAVGGTPRHVYRIFRAKNRRSDLPVIHITHNLARKLDPTLKPCNLKEMTCLTRFYTQKPKCPRRFGGIGPEILHTCST